jgi:hypothetical protein
MLSGLLGSLLGLTGSIVPAVTDHFASKRNNEFELKKMEKMAELRAAGFDHDMKMFETKAADDEHARLIAHDISINQGTGFIAGLQKSVRPIITYSFFGLFAVIEVTLLMNAMNAEDGVDFNNAIAILWDDDTKAIFAAIISFWFGSRALDKSRGFRK